MKCKVCGNVALYAMNAKSGEVLLCGVACQKKLLGGMYPSKEETTVPRMPDRIIPVVYHGNAVFPRNATFAPMREWTSLRRDTKPLFVFLVCDEIEKPILMAHVNELKKTCHFLAIISTRDIPLSKKITHRGIPVFYVDPSNIEQVEYEMGEIMAMIYRVHVLTEVRSTWSLSRITFVDSNYVPSIYFWNSVAKLESDYLEHNPDFSLEKSLDFNRSPAIQFEKIGVRLVALENWSEEDVAKDLNRILFVLATKHTNRQKNQFRLMKAETKKRLSNDSLYGRDVVLVHLYNEEKRSTDSNELDEEPIRIVDIDDPDVMSVMKFPWTSRQRGGYLNIGIRKIGGVWKFKKRDLYAMKNYATGIAELPLVHRKIE